MSNRDHPHDKLFKLALGSPKDVALELKAILPPALVANFDFESLAPVPDTFVDGAFKGSYADLLYTVRYRERDALLYVLFEHKSRPHRFTMVQLLRYMVRIWEKCLATKPRPAVLPPIIPVVVFHSDKGKSPPTEFQALFDPELMTDAELARVTPAFAARLDDIGRLSDEALRARAMGPEATLGLLFLRDGRGSHRILEELANWAGEFRSLMATQEGQRAIEQLFSYLTIVVADLDPEELTDRIKKSVPETENLIMTVAEQLIKRGKLEGRAEGRQEGRHEGTSSLVRRQIELKFGHLDERALARLDAADEATLVQFGERVLTATSLEEVLED